MIYSNQTFMILPNNSLSPDLQLTSSHLPFSPYLHQLLIQAQNLKNQNFALHSQIKHITQETQLLRAENNQLREQFQQSNIKIKRKYRKRRTCLQKKFECKVNDCGLKYSSKVALNSHLRKKHQIDPNVCL